jgi:hypothetical protein
MDCQGANKQVRQGRCDAVTAALRPCCYVREPLPDPEDAMSADNKTPFEQVNDAVTQLKEMRHYSKNNVEQLTTQWLLFDGELSKLKQAERIEQLMTQQGRFYDALEEEIATLEELAVQLKPAEEGGGELH